MVSRQFSLQRGKEASNLLPVFERADKRADLKVGKTFRKEGT